MNDTQIQQVIYLTSYTVKITVNLTVKDCKIATVQTCYMVNGKFPYYKTIEHYM